MADARIVDTPPPVVLASASVARRSMLSAAGLTFDVVPARIDEDAVKSAMVAVDPYVSPAMIAARLAQEKALAVARNLSTLDALARKSTMDLATAMPIHQFVDQTFGVLGFGAIGYVMDKLKFPLPPVVLGLILGGFAEENLRLALRIGRGDWTVLFQNTTSLVLVALTVAVVVGPLVKRHFAKAADTQPES